VRYRWHAYVDRDLGVLYRETRRGEIVYICVMPDGTGGVVPEWMFDSAASAHFALGNAQLSIDALVDLRALLDAIGFDCAESASLVPTKEVRCAIKCDLIRTSPPTTLPLMLTSREVVRDESRRKRGGRAASKTAVAGRAGARSVELSDDAP
jgi:hypothetical protein